eukprot:3575541-Heterocapsa_arctica.AAC.1
MHKVRCTSSDIGQDDVIPIKSMGVPCRAVLHTVLLHPCGFNAKGTANNYVALLLTESTVGKFRAALQVYTHKCT